MNYPARFSLKALRVNSQKTLIEASKLLGVSKKTLANYESGKTAPSLPMAQKMADLYGVTLDNISFFFESK